MLQPPKFSQTARAYAIFRSIEIELRIEMEIDTDIDISKDIQINM